MMSEPEFYTKYFRLVKYLVKKYYQNNNTFEREDLEQDVWLKIHKNFGNIWDKPETTSTYLGYIVRGVVCRYCRHSMSQIRDARKTFRMLPKNTDDDDFEFPDTHITNRTIDEYLDLLPEGIERQCINLTFNFGYTQREIAEITRQTISNIEWFLKKALGKIRKKLLSKRRCGY